MWAVVVVALILGASRLETPLGVWAYAISCLATVRTLRVAVRFRHEGRALGAVGLAGLIGTSALGSAILVTGGASAFLAVTEALYRYSHYSHAPVALELFRLVAGLLAGGMVVRVLVPVTWKYPWLPVAPDPPAPK